MIDRSRGQGDSFTGSPAPQAVTAEPRSHRLTIVSTLALAQFLVAVLILGVHGTPGVLGGDFIAYYGAGNQALAGDWAHLYDLSAQLPFQRAPLAHSGLPAGGPAMIPFDYPPPAALLFMPFALLPAGAATVLWLAVNSALVGISWTAMVRKRANLPGMVSAWGRSPFAPLALLSLLPVAWGLLSGQPVGILLILVELSFRALLARRDTRAGIWFGLLAILKPQLVLVPLLGLLVLGRLRFIGGAALTGLALLLLSLATVGFRGLLAYVQLLHQIDPILGSTAFSIRTEAMVNWRAWITAIPGIDGQTALLLTTAAAVITVGGVLVLCVRRRCPATFTPTYLALTAAGLLASYHSHYQDLVVLLPPALAMLSVRPGGPPPVASRTSGPRPRRVALPAAALLLVVIPGVAWLAFGVFALSWLPILTALAVPGLAFVLIGAGRVAMRAVPQR